MGSTATATHHGSFNTGVGYQTLLSNTTGFYNSTLGYQALYSNTTGNQNAAMGWKALYANTDGGTNTAVGSEALFANISGSQNTAIGQRALFNNTGRGNSAMGTSALQSNTTGIYNTAVGYLALSNITTANSNTGVGLYAGNFISGGVTPNQTSNTSLYLGYDTRALADGDANKNVIGYNATGVGSNSVVLGNDSVTKTVLKGNVGIGTTSPQEKLQIEGAGGATFRIQRNDSVVAAGRFDFTGSDGVVDSRISYNAAVYQGLEFYTGGITSDKLRLLITDSGNVGIGTTSPTNLLSLGGTAERTIWMERNTTAAAAGQGLTLSSGGAIAGTADLAGGDLTLKSGISTGTGTSALHFFTATAGSTGTADNTPTEKMTILGSGNVGIGTTNPGRTLSVNGFVEAASGYVVSGYATD